MKTMNASDFAARCLAILDEVESSGEVITILKPGQPVAQLVPPMYIEKGYPQHELAGKRQDSRGNRLAAAAGIRLGNQESAQLTLGYRHPLRPEPY